MGPVSEVRQNAIVSGHGQLEREKHTNSSAPLVWRMRRPLRRLLGISTILLWLHHGGMRQWDRCLAVVSQDDGHLLWLM